MQQEHWLADRAMLQRLLQEHPEWSRQGMEPTGNGADRNSPSV
jgi:hypothetical protein